MKTHSFTVICNRSAFALTALAVVFGCSAADDKKDGSGGGSSSAGSGGNLSFGGSSSGGSSSGGSNSGGSSFGGSSFGGTSSGGSGGEGDTGGVGGGTGDVCEDCFDANCAAEGEACEASPACGALFDCWDTCAETDDACYEACDTANAAGLPLVDAMDACEQAHCAAQCPED